VTYDIENLLGDIESLLKQNLNTEIAKIEAEKASQGKAVGLPGVDPNAYYEQSWNDEILNRAPAIFFGIADTDAEGAGPATIEKFKLFIEVVVIDSGMDKFTSRRVHRYSRAVKKVLQDGFANFPVAGKIKIVTVVPASFRLNADSSDNIKVGGVVVTAAIA
jgi:hypothetical protein